MKWLSIVGRVSGEGRSNIRKNKLRLRKVAVDKGISRSVRYESARNEVIVVVVVVVVVESYCCLIIIVVVVLAPSTCSPA